MVDLEVISENRFYKLVPLYQQRCTNQVEDIYEKVDSEHRLPTKMCNGVLWLNMKDGSINLRCKHPDCRLEYEIPRVCSYCDKKHLFEDTTCDNCEPIVINIATWKVSIDECDKAIKKINRAYKQDLISEKEWKTVRKINEEEREKCLKNLAKVEKDLGLSTS